MRILIILAFAGFIGRPSDQASINLNDNQIQMYTALFRKCIRSENISGDDIRKIQDLNIVNPSDGIKCISACFLESIGALEGTKMHEYYVRQNFGLIFNEETTNNVLRHCKDIRGANRCDMGFKHLQCIARQVVLNEEK